LPATPGYSLVAVVPCPRCRTYSTHVVTADGTSSSRRLDLGTEADVKEGAG
jgi:hypothetical protein